MRAKATALLVALALTISATAAFATCWEAVSAKYGIPVPVLKGIAEQESHFNNAAVSHDADGSRGVCMMQVNSSWFGKLAKYGITEQTLRQDACVCLDVGAWILAQNIRDLGANWDAIGAYNARTLSKRQVYAWKVKPRIDKYYRQANQ